MRRSPVPLFSLSVLAALFGAAALAAQTPRSPNPTESSPPFRTRTATSSIAAQMVPYDSLSPPLRERVRTVMNRPTLVTHADPEEFQASPKLYETLLDHPDRATLAYQRLGVECTPITDRGNGRFGWSDNQGSDMVWYTIANGPTARIWFAEGQIRAGSLLPLIPARVVVVLRHDYLAEDTATPRVRHQVDVFAHADSRAANIVTRLFGGATDNVAEQASEQLLMFFSLLSHHLAEHPERAEKLLAPPRATR